MNAPSLRLVSAAIALCGLVSAASLARADNEPQDLPVTTLNAGFYNIRAQLARSEEEREIGLMFRKSMPTSDGMLFIFEADAQQCFWMKNTLIPLAVAFVADDGTIVNVDEMKSQTLDSHCSARPVRYVLEMNQGWFTKRGFKAGSKLSGPPFAK